VRADNLTPTVSRSRQCEILNISQPYRPPRPVMGIALLLLFVDKNNWPLFDSEREIYVQTLKQKVYALHLLVRYFPLVFKPDEE
jgi:hypothetical protein